MKGARAATATRLLLLFVFTVGVAAALSAQLFNTQWSSSLADALPNEVSDLQRSYLENQQPNAQQLLLGFESQQYEDTEILNVVQQQLSILLRAESVIQLAEMTNPEAVLSFYQQQAGRLATQRDRQMLASGDYEALITNAQKTLQSPAPVLTSLQQDPLLLTQRFIQQLPDLMPGYESHGGLYTRTSQSTHQVLVPLRIAGDALSVNQSGRSVQVINDFTAKVSAQLPNIKVYRSGLLFHSDAAAKQAKQEMTWFGGLSLLLVLALLLWVFRSAQQLLYTLFLLGVSAATGLLITLLFSTQPHVLMLVFATSFIGLCIDYVIHGFIARSHGEKAWSALKPALWLSGLTTVVGYVLLLLLPLPLLQQLGIFMATALLTAITLVVVTLPWLPEPKEPAPRWQQFCLGMTKLYRQMRHKTTTHWLSVMALATLGLLVWSFTANDNVRLLASSPESLLQQENHLRETTDFYFQPDVLLVAGETRQDALERTASLRSIEGSVSLYHYVVPVSEQQQLLQDQQNLFNSQVGEDYLQWLGIGQPIRASESPEHPLQNQFLYPMEAGWMSVVRLKQPFSADDIKEKPGRLEHFNPIEHASDALTEYRHSMQLWLIALLLVSLPILALFLRSQQGHKQRVQAAWQVVCVMTLSVSTALLLAQLIQPLNLFHCIGAMFVLVLSIDYGVFCAGRLERQHALQAIYLSAFTTMVAFGALSFSATPAIAAFGVIVLIGVFMSALFSPLIIESPDS
ncbi:MMPL family transporter [Idiomarina ramblicola]|uniref:RND transporter n=1 Tax=Idiomarina ramblicola TaxID=263724 RepID=A0A432Z018_9GAMM|nr:MMPL family transporter [Idiomarina ramblicola]RUO69538.1 RND transporter [Idiomarina ramblicola]